MRKDSRFWLSKMRGWASSLLVVAAPLVLSASGASAAENYYIADEQAVAEAPSASDVAAPPAYTAPATPYAYAPAPAAAEEAPAEPEKDYWTLMDTGFGQRLACNNARIYGNMAQSYTYNPDHPRDRFNGPVTWTDRSNEYQLNQLWLGAEKTTDTSEQTWDLGGRVDAFYGSNARFCTAQGFENSIDNGQSFYGIAVPNMYGEVAYNDVKVKVGRFISPVGYFTIDTTQNFFNTIPYTYQYGEPFTHTGALATWTANDHWTLASGVDRGWDNFSGTGFGAPSAGYIGTATYTGDNDGSLTWFGHYSREPNERTTVQNNDYNGRYMQSLVYLKKLSDRWNYVLQSDYGVQANAKANGQGAEWYGVNQYLFWKQNECLTWGANAEWFRDDDGYRVGTILPAFPGSEFRGVGSAPNLPRNGYIGNFYQVTLGPRWTPYSNLTIRPNVRLDWFDGTIDANKNAAGLRPYDDGTKNHQTIFATDVYFLF